MSYADKAVGGFRRLADGELAERAAKRIIAVGKRQAVEMDGDGRMFVTDPSCLRGGELIGVYEPKLSLYRLTRVIARDVRHVIDVRLQVVKKRGRPAQLTARMN